MARRGDDGEHDYSGGAATVASAMAWEREGEELGANGGVQEGRGATWSSSRPSGLREGEAGRRAAAWRAAVPPPSTLAACLASQAARWSGGRARPARWAGWWATGKFFPFFLFLFFLFNISATLLNLIKYLGNFKNHQTIPGP